MQTNILLTVSLIWAIAAIIPGPNFFITVHTAVGETRRLSFFTVLGIVIGTLVWSLSGYLGLSIIFKTVPILYYSLKVIGGLYLVYIGLNLISRNKGNQIQNRKEKSLTAVTCFRLGLFTNLLNPKTAAFMTSLFAATIPPDASLETGSLCVTLICAISAIWYSLVATVFSFELAQNAFINYKRVIERVAGGIFIVFGLKLAISK